MPVYALDDLVPVIDPDAYVHPDAVIIGNVQLGPGASVWPGAVLRGDHGLIRIGDRTSIQDGTVVHTTREWPTMIGADCVVGHLAHLEGCVVEDGCLIGSGSLVLNRARVQAGAVVAAAVIRTAAPPDETTSSVAGAIWGPHLVEDSPRVARWGLDTLAVLREFAG